MSPLRPIARRALAAQSDDRLVRLLREGREPAFEEMVRRYRAPLVAFATAIVSHDRAEDVVQASLEKAHRTLLADSREVALRAWLFTIVRNGALNTIRNEPLTDELLSGSATVPGPSELAEQHEELERLVEAMCALPPSQREALVKRELEGVGHAEIAAQLGTTSTAVRGLIFRARTSLRDAVGAFLPLPLLRMLLTESPAVAGVAGGGASAGAGAAILGGAGAKGGTVIAAAVVALGTGIAIDHGRNSEGAGGSPAKVAIERSSGSNGDAASSTTPAVAVPARDASGSGSSGADDGSGSSDEASGNSGDEGEGGGGDDSGSGVSGSRISGDGDESGTSGGSGEAGAGSSGSGSGHDGGSDDSGGSDHSGASGGSGGSGDSGSSGSSGGSGGSGSGESGSGDTLVPPPADSGSGSGSGSSGGDDGSGSGSSGGGDGSGGGDSSGSGSPESFD